MTTPMQPQTIKQGSATATLKVTTSKASASDLQAELEKLRAENELLKAKAMAGRNASVKVTEKGALSFYGVGRWPVTLYKSQWAFLLSNAEQIKTALETLPGLTEKPQG